MSNVQSVFPPQIDYFETLMAIYFTKRTAKSRLKFQFSKISLAAKYKSLPNWSEPEAGDGISS